MFPKKKPLLKKVSFRQRRIDALRHEIRLLDQQAMGLTSDPEKYYANRKVCWELIDKLGKEGRKWSF